MKITDSDGTEYEVITLKDIKPGDKFYMKEDIENGMQAEYEKIHRGIMSFCLTPSGNRQHYKNNTEVCKI